MSGYGPPDDPANDLVDDPADDYADVRPHLSLTLPFNLTKDLQEELKLTNEIIKFTNLWRRLLQYRLKLTRPGKRFYPNSAARSVMRKNVASNETLLIVFNAFERVLFKRPAQLLEEVSIKLFCLLGIDCCTNHIVD